MGFFIAKKKPKINIQINHANFGPSGVVTNDKADTFVNLETGVATLNCSDDDDDTDDVMEEMDVQDDTADVDTDPTMADFILTSSNILKGLLGRVIQRTEH